MQIRGNSHYVLALSVILAMGLIFVLIQFDTTVFDKDRMADVEVTTAVDDLQIHYAEYAIWTLKFRESTFEWNLRSTKIIFWVSIIVSMSGMMFAFWQFLDAGNKDQRAAEADELEVKTQMASIAFKSRSLASLVLFVSIAYLLIYVTFVYPIKSTHDELDFEEAVGNLGQEDGAAPGGQMDASIDQERLPAGDGALPAQDASMNGMTNEQPSSPVLGAPDLGAIKGVPDN